MLFAIRWAAKSTSTKGSRILVIARTVIIWLRTVSAASKSLALRYWKTVFKRRRALKTLSAKEEKECENVKERKLTLTIDHLSLVNGGGEGEPLSLKMLLHLLCFG